jgi:uncharacterized protein (DUF58 family)
MTRRILLFVLLLWSVFSLNFDTTSAEKKADLAVRKMLMSRPITYGQDVAVSVRIFNVGTAPAYDIFLNDSTWDPDAFSVEIGLTEAKWDRIPAGSNITHNYVVRPLIVGEFTMKPAVVHYHNVPKGPRRVSYSTSLGKLKIYSETEAPRRGGSHLKEWAIFVGLSALSVIFPLTVYVYVLINYKDGVPKKHFISSKK